MVAEPYYNEPSYEAQRGTKEGDKASREYNEQIQANNIRYAMVQQLRQPALGFEDVIRLHFSILKEEIMNHCCQWLNECQTDKLKMKKAILQLQSELNKL